MVDLNHTFGEDLLQSGSGDIATVDGSLEGQQRVLRRLLTTPGEWIFHTDYGAGLARFIGQPGNGQQIAAITRAQMFQEAVVLRNPPPQINVIVNTDGTFILNVTYTDAASNQPVFLSVPVS